MAQAMFLFTTAMLDTLHFLSCRSLVIEWDEAASDVTKLANTHKMIEHFRQQSAKCLVYPELFLASTHDVCESLYEEHLAPHIKLLGQPQFRPDATASDIADVNKKAADRHSKWVDPYTTAAVKWRTQLQSYWADLAKAMDKERRVAVSRKEDTNKIGFLTRRHQKVLHLWRNSDIHNLLGIPLSTPVPLLCKGFMKSVNALLEATAPAIEMVRFTLNWASSNSRETNAFF